ncbi:MAG: U32 family peptidase [Lentisphaeria bacterium]|nr:U32 family peptidase [Lentisphaeria bacterium]
MSIELLSPAGSFESLSAALANGADAVYFGVGKLNMRSRATVNFTIEDLREIAERCHEKGVKAWMTLNTVLFDGELEEARLLCKAAKKAGIDAVIAADTAVLEMAKKENLSIHLSVQANITNLEAVKFYAKYADVMVLARELNLQQIAAICEGIRRENITGPAGKLIKIEAFVHGALCVAVSGKCYMSLALFNSSANRGDCYQPCRRSYTVRDTVNQNELAIENNYVMSPSDICTIEILPRMLDAGVQVLKIEGRGRSADYVAKVTKVYKEAILLYEKNIVPPEEQKENWKKSLQEVFNRGFWHGGYYLGEKIGEWAESGENKATRKKVLCGKVLNYFSKAKIAQILLTSGDVKKGDSFLVTGPTTGAEEGVLTEFQANDRKAESASKGMEITFPFEKTLRKNDSFFLLITRE